MTTTARITLSAIALLLSAAVSTAGARPMTVDDLHRISTVEEVAVSPDGGHIAYTLEVQRDPFSEEQDGPPHRHLYVSDGDETRAFVTGNMRVSEIAWRPDGEAVGFLAKRGDDEFASLYEIPVAGGEARRVHDHGSDIKDFAWVAGGDAVVYLSAEAESEREKKLADAGFTAKAFEEAEKFVRAWRLDVTSGDAEPERLPLEASALGIEAAPGGERLAIRAAPTPLVDDDLVNSRFHLMDPDGGDHEVVATPGKLGDFAFSPDGRHLAFNAGVDANDPGSGVLVVADASSGDFEMLTPEAPFHVVDVAWLDDEHIAAVVRRREASELAVYSIDGERLATHENAPRVVESVDAAGGTTALVANAPSHPAELFRWSDGEAERLSDHNDWLDDIELTDQRVYTYQARDGLEVSGVLFEPLDGSEPAPLWVMPHGGPESHRPNGWLTRYSRPAQIAAAQGYAVYFPNYRGSTGRGVAFAKRHQNDYAGGEFDDIADAMDALVEDGIAHPERVVISGGSYGGYASAWAATAFSDRFQAAVVHAGISNQISKFGTTDIPEEMYRVHSLRWPWEDWSYMLERSPITHAGESDTPVLITHGESDTRVHPSQSLELYRHLELRSEAPVRLITYPGEPHGLTHAAARFDYAKRLMRWMNHYVDGEGGEPPPVELGIADRIPEGKEPVEGKAE